VSVPTICSRSSRSVVRMHVPLSRPRPIRHSQAASPGSTSPGATSPNLSVVRVRAAKSAAGLQSGTNLSTPNQKKPPEAAAQPRHGASGHPLGHSYVRLSVQGGELLHRASPFPGQCPAPPRPQAREVFP
jgi:hypothetical protein